MNSLTTQATSDVTLTYFDGNLDAFNTEASGDTIKVAVCDTETTGLDNYRDDVIELGLVIVELTADTHEFVKVVDVYNGLQAIEGLLDPIITKVTGITDADLKGQSLDLARIEELVKDCEVVICHNAKFDRPFLERTSDVFKEKNFACSLAEIDWKGYGFVAASLGVILIEMGMVGSAHRAEGDCRMLARVLLEKNEFEGGSGNTFFDDLMKSSAQSSMIVKAVDSPFAEKDILKFNGFRWNGTDKFWHTEVVGGEAGVAAMQAELESMAFTGRLEVVGEKDASQRYKLK